MASNPNLRVTVDPEDEALAELPTRAQTAAYVAALSHDLAAIARGCGLDTLGYILEMAAMEADSYVRPGREVPN